MIVQAMQKVHTVWSESFRQGAVRRHAQRLAVLGDELFRFLHKFLIADKERNALMKR